MPLVYMATNTVNGKQYVGATVGRLSVRRSGHKHDAFKKRPGCNLFHAALRKYGIDAFEWSIIADCASPDEMMEVEHRLVREIAPEYNLAEGGRSKRDRPHAVSRPDRSKRSRPVVCLTDGQAFPSGRAAATAYGVGVMTILKCCQGSRTNGGLRFRYADGPELDKHKKTKAVRDAIRARQNAGLAKSWAQTQKPVMCLDDGTVYPSITHAAVAIGKHVSLVSAAIYRNGRCGGRRFRFVEGAHTHV